MRQSLKNKETFDINKVPPEARDKVQAMMGKPPSGPNAAAPAAKAP